MKRAFIENDTIIEEDDKLHFEDLTGLNWDKDINIQVTEAYLNLSQVWAAIKSCHEIYISTSFIGDSGRLLIKMLEAAKLNNIKNKKIINLRSRDAMWHMPGGVSVYAEFLKNNNIKFIYKEDI